VILLDELEDRNEDDWLYVSPIKPPTPAQKKLRVTDWLVQDMDKDDLLSVRQHLSFQSQPIELEGNTATTRDLLSNSVAKDSLSDRTIPRTQSLQHRNHLQYEDRKAKPPNGNKKVRDQLESRNNVYGYQDRQEKEELFHTTEDDELWEFQQNEEKMELDEFAEVEAMINEGHDEEASEELFHAGHLIDKVHPLQMTDYSALDARVYQPLSSVSTKTTSIRPTTMAPRHTVANTSNDQVVHLISKNRPGKFSAANSKDQRTLQPPKAISKLPGSRHKSQSVTDSQESKLQAPRIVSMSGSVGKSRLPMNPQRSMKMPSKIGVRQSTTQKAEHGRIQVAVKRDQLVYDNEDDDDDDESWKEGCF
jgi:hypothetical protein